MWQILQAYSGAVVAVFTVVLVGVTVVYVFVTCRLLKQSKNAFLADITLRVMGMCQRESKEIETGKDINHAVFIVAWMKAYREAFMKIDKKLGMDVTKLIEVCLYTAAEEEVKGRKKLKEKEEENKDLLHHKND